MIKTELKNFISTNEESTLIDYSKTLLENLKDLNAKEEKHNLWILIMVFLYIIMSNANIESFSIGPITIKDISIIGKILPLIFTYVFFSIRTITGQKTEILQALKILSEKQFNLMPENLVEQQIGIKTIVRLYLPYTFTNSILKLFRKKPSTIESLIGAPLIIPILLVGLAPYVIIILMLIDLWNNSLTDLLGWACFLITIWLMLIMIFYMVKNLFNSIEESSIPYE